MSDEPHERIFGPDRDEEPGLTFQPEHEVPPQFIEITSESAAVHSESRGWIPVVVIRLATDDGAGLIGMIEVGEDLTTIIKGIHTAGQRALDDLAAGHKDGTFS